MKKPHGSFKSRLGEKHFSKQGEEVEIVEYFGWDNCSIMFPNKFILRNVQYSAIVVGRFKNPYLPSVCDIGFVGYGEYVTHIGHIASRAYATWSSMFSRCYRNRHKSYKEVVVCDEWHNFQIFAKWYYQNQVEDWHLDKDILVKWNKIYSPETCCFVPPEINYLFIKRQSDRGKDPIGITEDKGLFKARISINNERVYLGIFNNKEDAFLIYKEAKEKNIQKIAIKWKDKIEEKVYIALINYKVEITD